MGQRLVQVDAFTDQPFAGNPAAVCVLETLADDGWMQRVALEMNLSETAFLVARSDGAFDLRWFTPAKEVELCGHATLAAAHVLWEEGRLAADEVARFHTLSGVLTATRHADGIELDFPATPAEALLPPDTLAPALGVEPRWVGKNRFDYLVEVESEAVVRELEPDVVALAKIDARGFLVTARASTAGLDFVSRCFFPAYGVPEDPVTGSAHCSLGPYWAAALAKDDLEAFQASARGGRLRVLPRGDRVRLRGQAVSVARLELLA